MALFFWSTTAIANKIAVGFMDGLSAGMLRSLLAGILAISIVLAFKYPFPRIMSDRVLLAVSGISSFAVWPVLMSIGIEHTSVGHAALIMALIPVFTVLFACVVEQKLPKLGWWFGACLALCATGVLIFVKNDGYSSFALNANIQGDLYVLIGGMVCAVGYVAGGNLSPKLGTAPTTFWGLSIALLVLVPLYLLFSTNIHWPDIPLQGWLAILWMTLLSSLLGYALWFFALGYGGISRIGSLLLIMPVITLLLAALVLHEAITMFMLVICLCIVLGTYYAQKHAH
ncbi:MAG: DMT family transporter [Gammaproteobacteria bacterium]|nr:DMT family transporter [Gammaproteobacteria bacterium]